RFPPAANPGAGKPGECFLRAAETAVHQLVGAEHYGELGAATLEAQFLAPAGHRRRIKLQPWDHARLHAPLRPKAPALRRPRNGSPTVSPAARRPSGDGTCAPPASDRGRYPWPSPTAWPNSSA